MTKIRTIEAKESEDGQVHHMGRCFSIMHEGMENDITEVVKNRWGQFICIPCKKDGRNG
tara:strand:+ start:339 stop:515 length:177 start_codon:yes stop_codon:yes gene_type:complete